MPSTRGLEYGVAGGLAALLLATSGCGAWDDEARARDVAERLLGCFETRVTRTEAHRFRAEGCGRRADIACSEGSLEPVCIQVRSRALAASTPTDATDGLGEVLARASAAAFDPAAGVGDAAALEALEPDPDADDEGPPTASRAANGTSAEDLGPSAGGELDARSLALRAALDARAEDVLACVGGPRVVLRALVREDGVVELGLRGALAGSPEEGCVQAALADLRAAAGPAQTVVHLVRAPDPAPSSPAPPESP